MPEHLPLTSKAPPTWAGSIHASAGTTSEASEFLRLSSYPHCAGAEEPPTFLDVDGRTPEESPDKLHKRARLWTALAHFSPRVRELWKLHLDDPKKDWMWHISAMDYLLEMSQPVSWEPRHIRK